MHFAGSFVRSIFLKLRGMICTESGSEIFIPGVSLEYTLKALWKFNVRKLKIAGWEKSEGRRIFVSDLLMKYKILIFFYSLDDRCHYLSRASV